MSNNHTPGPWNIDENFAAFDGEEFMSIEYHGFQICTVRGTNDMSCLEDDEQEKVAEECMANAKLIAAAPELLDAASSVLDTLEAMNKDSMIDGMMMVLREAIKKATDE